jgi:hypothetical protein
MILAAGLGLMDAAVARAATLVAEALVHDGPPPIIDGRLDEAVWAKARPIDGLVQDEPLEGMRPSERTEVRLLVDGTALYVGARLYDSRPEGIIARLDRRDGGTANDSFTLFLDPLRDGRTGVYFGVSASGTQHDGTMSNDDWRDDTWNPVWDSEVSRDGTGWAVEMRIPLSQLRFQAASGRRWGINLKRVIERKHEFALLTITPRAQSGFVSRFAELAGVEAVKPPPLPLELVPYVSGKTEWRTRASDDPFDDGPVSGRAGLDLKLGLGGNFSLEGAINPDFGQVEVDPAVINLSDVETFYPEKRTFFIEGSNMWNDFGRGGARDNWGFNYGNPLLFYSRRVGRTPQGELPDDKDYARVPDAANILGAAKLLGSQGPWTVGTLHAVTAKETAEISTAGNVSKLAVEPLSYYGLGRVQRTFADGRYGVGLLSTAVARDLSDPVLREQFNDQALVAALDGWTQLGAQRTYALTAWWAASRVDGSPERIEDVQRSSVRYMQRPDASHLGVDPTRTSLSGHAGRVALNKQNGRVIMNSAAAMHSPGFDANDAGFVRTTDLVNAHYGMGYQWPDPGRWFRYANAITAAFGAWDLGGNNTGLGSFTALNAELANYWSMNADFVLSPQTLDARRTRGGPLMLRPAGWGGSFQLRSDPQKRIFGALWSGVSRGRQGDGRSFRLGGSLTGRPSDRFNVSVEPQYTTEGTSAQYLETLDDPTAVETYGQRYLFGVLRQRMFSANLRGSVIFTPRMSFELFVQPLLSSLRFSDVRQLARPRSYDFLATGIDPAQYNETVLSLRGSAVLRWEYRRGCTFYLVWNGNQARESDSPRFNVGHGLGDLTNLAPNHVFMAKLTYWWSPS